MDKIDHGGTYIIIVGNMVHILKNLIHNMEYMIQQFQMSLKKTLWLEILKIVYHHLLILTRNMVNHNLLTLYNKTMKRHLMMFSNKIWIGVIYCWSIFHNYILNLKRFNFLIISSASTMLKLLRKMNKKVKCHQLINLIFSNSVSLCNIFSIIAIAPLWHMACKKAKGVPKKTLKF